MSNKVREMLKLNQLIVPSYVERFECRQCGRCCRRNWRIDIDEEVYQCLKAEYAAKGKEIEIELMVRNDALGKRIHFSEQGKCAALNEENHCQCQLELGAEYLSDTCKIYPRIMYASSRGIEFSLYFSCPAAAELLLQTSPVSFSQLNSGDTRFYFMHPKKIAYYLSDFHILEP